MVFLCDLGHFVWASVAALCLVQVPSLEAAPFSSWAGKRAVTPARAPLDVAHSMHDLRDLYLLQQHLDDEEQPVAEFALQDYGKAQDEIRRPPYFLTACLEPLMAKRAPFSSWAGKRAPFSSWAGKRKRAPFSSWAGKRKRAPFSSWAGKRSAPEYDMEFNDMDQEVTEPESKLRLKRSSDERELDEDEAGVEGILEHPRQRRGANSFSAWGGKRLMRFTRNAPVVNNGLVPVRVLRPQRAAFSAWGG